MSYRFYLSGETPAKKNSKRIVRHGRLISSQKFYEWHDLALSKLLKQEKPKSPLEAPLKINLKFYHGDKMRRDSDNQTTSILDLLKDANIIKDDNWQIITKIQIQNFFDKNNSHCEIEITKLTV